MTQQFMTQQTDQMLNRPHIYEYLNYRTFLKDMYHFKKQECPAFSYRSFSRVAGLKSSNFLKLVMDGKRNISNEAIHKFAKALRLLKAETNFFESLVLFNQAKTSEEKNRYYERISQTKNYNDIKKIEAHQYNYFSNWYYVAIRELVRLNNFREDPHWINRKLGTNLTHEEIKKVIQTLIHLKLLYRDQYNLLKQSEEKIVASPDLAHLAVLNFHREMMGKAQDSLEKSKTVDRDISALTIGISKGQYEKIKERINQFRREIHSIASEEKQSEAVYQINFQLFNLSEVPWS